MLCAAAALALSAARAGGFAGDAVTVTVSTTALSPGAIPADFVGLSQEVGDAPTFMGRFPSPPNGPFAQLMANLREASGGGPGPQIRVGGNSADHSLWWPAGGAPLPPNQSYAITAADFASYAAALPLWNGSIVVDTSMFLQDNSSWAESHVRAVAAGLGWSRVAGVEVGNEVENYHDDGQRPPSWSYSSYVREWEAHVRGMEAAGMPRGRVQGAVFCCNNSEYNAALANYTQAYARAGVLASVSYHRYALGGCGGKAVTMAELLADGAVDSVAAYVAPFAAAARGAGIPFRIGEGNSVSCGGRANVSDVFGVALWALDAMLACAAAGVATFNFHGGPHAAYSPITMLALPSVVPEVRPLYYAMWAMAGLAANGARVMAAATDATNSQIKAWATRDDAGVWRAVLLHKDPAAAAPAAVVVAPPAPATAPATLARLRTDSPLGVLARWNVTWRGQTFDGSQDGRPMGARVEEHVPATAAGGYAFALPPGTAAVLTWGP